MPARCTPATLAREDGFTVHTLRMGGLARLLRGMWSVSRLVRRERFDVVNTTSRRDALIAAAGARRAARRWWCARAI